MTKKKISCADLVPGCGFTAEAATEEELIKKVVEHAAPQHAVKEVTPELLKKIKSAIREG